MSGHSRLLQARSVLQVRFSGEADHGCRAKGREWAGCGPLFQVEHVRILIRELLRPRGLLRHAIVLSTDGAPMRLSNLAPPTCVLPAVALGRCLALQMRVRKIVAIAAFLNS
jgi:hypothetical protein